MIASRIVRGGSSYVELRELKDRVTGAYITDATVAFDLVDEELEPIVIERAMPFIEDGTYRAVLNDEDTEDLRVGSYATVTVWMEKDGHRMPFVSRVQVSDSGRGYL